ncbi:PREDICTED: probable glycerol-3-phosphate acyltransferase 2 isoform X1 [Lupinus angustifolius]|uniref:probable glycerol-3-phosphate acyltransferase 2 isoform X1 n=1 Tax=Lupinus angustifolius TaxID=3871 RepID=UPI00092F47AC|nr:PREDICTED: probable glycerol-3-phosphate acyltransferase 2 isoform X1 [Lupinus angustifolius]
MDPSNKVKVVSLFHKTTEPANKTLVFEFEGTLLRSSSLFPYFMLVAFEAGGILRSLILFLSYPLVWLVGEDQLGLEIMVFLCFFGIRKDTFRIGSSILPKFFLEDVGWEGFEDVMCCEKKVASSKLPRVMVEGFLKDYLSVEGVVARELKTFNGYFLGLFEEKKVNKITPSYEGKTKACNDNTIGIGGSHFEHIDKELFPHFKKVYLSKERKNWHVLPREKYPKPLIFHDGRLAFRPTPTSSLALFMWLPFALFLAIFRFIFGTSLPFNVSAPILAFSGTRTTLSKPFNVSLVHNKEDQKSMLYVCNHRTLLDPLYIAYVLNKPLSAVTYSLSKFNELVSPIKTIRLTRDREKDREAMVKLLKLGNLVICPEGTTCREPYLLRFSPLFAELTDDIVPVAVDVKVTMFYGTTASGHKWLDPFFHFLNPNPTYFIKFLERVPESETCMGGGKSRIEVANFVQNEIGKGLGFACTSFTRKDKYLVLAGNEGVYDKKHGSPYLKGE